MLRAASIVALAGCASSYPVAAKPAPCKVPAPPPELVLAPHPCGGEVCYSVEDTIKFIRWFNADTEYHQAIAACPYVVHP